MLLRCARRGARKDARAMMLKALTPEKKMPLARY
jgi:hypothetical protein